ncbi:EscU/YscU/HrcU family type III secretion system export apparatus switch protein [Jannaschia donghaensis]|uniref:Flagellar biosynthetic protein FlhB n=1 Tax=Jannaschia donghaensis TaxID=420998 RepID=A0A0M6YGN3_9RHOB|nr:flagellar type III secretion system protein FlhB [Jannaschia donghaensis]CTQ49094.1 Flagellar biosynthetic protein FlhB [Jannaschia donghaensis]
MSQDDGAERSHEATQQKLTEARKKGELVKSQDLATWASYLGALLCLILLAPGVGARLTDLGGSLLQNADALGRPLRAGGTGQAGRILGESLLSILLLTAPPAGLVIVVLIVQQAFVVAPTKLAPKLSRISLIANAGNKFGPNGLFEFAKSAVKMTLFGSLMGIFLVQNADRFVAAAAGAPRAIPAMIPTLLAEFCVVVVILSGAIAAIDYFWQRHTHLKKQMMTRQEVLDESKQSEGDPHVKGRRRQRAQEIALNQMLSDVPEATVVVVNPTHYAVALKWSPMDPSPPICVAKGVDHTAARIREVASEAGVPLFSDPPTARAIFASVEIGEPIDRAHFAAVAVAVRFARDLTRKDQP